MEASQYSVLGHLAQRHNTMGFGIAYALPGPCARANVLALRIRPPLCVLREQCWRGTDCLLRAPTILAIVAANAPFDEACTAEIEKGNMREVRDAVKEF